MFTHLVLNSTKINCRYCTIYVVMFACPSNSEVLFRMGTFWVREDKMDSE